MDGVSSLDKDTKKPPKERIKNELDARNVVTTLQDADRIRSPKRAKWQGMLDGNPPYNPSTLRAKGQGHRTNINLRESEGMLDAAKTPYYDLVFEVNPFAEIYLEYGDNPQVYYEWGKSMSKFYHDMLKGWPGMDYHFQLHQQQLCGFGAGPLAWRNSRDWRSQAAKAGQVLVPDDTPANLEELETMCTPRPIMPGDLYRDIENEKAAADAGWIVKACKQAIVDAAPEEPNQRNNWEYVQNQIRSGDVTWNAKSKKIFVVDLFQKEFDGKISHYILLDTQSVTTGSDGKVKSNDFLFKKIGRFDCFDNLICPFFYDVGNGEWNSVKGMLPKIYDYSNTSNVLTCDMIDGARLGSGVTLKATDANGLQTTQIVHIGGANVIQPGFDAVQTRIAENLQGPLAVKRDFQLTLQSNTGQYRQRVSEDNQEPTLGQAQLNARQQAVLGKGAVNRYYNSLDSWHKETLRRALAMGVKLYKRHKELVPGDETSLTPSERGALRFIQKCVEAGVPEEALSMDYICSISATRAVGYGSAQMQEVIMNELMQLLPFATPSGRNNILRRKASQLVGQSNVDSVIEPYAMADVPDDQVWSATMENNVLRQNGGQTQVTDNQDDFVHFGIHYADAQQHEQQTQQGGDPMPLLVHLKQAIPHMGQHLANMQGDPTRKDVLAKMAKGLMDMQNLSANLEKKIMAQMAAQAAANPPQPQPDPDLVKVLGDLQLKKTKTEGDMQLKAEKQGQQMRLKDLQAAHNMRLKTSDAAFDQMITAASTTTAPPQPASNGAM